MGGKFYPQLVGLYRFFGFTTLPNMARTFNTQPPCRAQVENQHEATVSSQCTLQVGALGLSAMAYAHGQGQVEAPLPA
jgi:uncharacterized protein HemX